jgi:hypothetical protein
MLGSRHVARRGAQLAPGRCPACGSREGLRSYDGLACLTLLSVPVLPLGWRHVWHECRRCGSARSLPARRWHELRLTTLSDALHACEAAPEDAAAARRALALVVDLHEARALAALSASIRAHLARDAGLLVELARAHGALGEDDAARACYRAALRLDLPPEARAPALAELAALQGLAAG